jgi:hypothetical protein
MKCDVGKITDVNNIYSHVLPVTFHCLVNKGNIVTIYYNFSMIECKCKDKTIHVEGRGCP